MRSVLRPHLLDLLLKVGKLVVCFYGFCLTYTGRRWTHKHPGSVVPIAPSNLLALEHVERPLALQNCHSAIGIVLLN